MGREAGGGLEGLSALRAAAQEPPEEAAVVQPGGMHREPGDAAAVLAGGHPHLGGGSPP